jgi:hypothetical protein
VTPTAEEALPEVAGVHWRARMDARRLRRVGRLWTASTASHVVPFLVTAAILPVVEPLLLPMSVACVANAWLLPELYANRGAKVVRPKRRRGEAEERTALGLLGDLLDHHQRDVHSRTGLVPEPGRLGTWLVGEAGALLVSPDGGRVACWCVRVDHPELPAADRTAHLLLALRADEEGFATVANLAFSGARWRVRRRLAPPLREALDIVSN